MFKLREEKMAADVPSYGSLYLQSVKGVSLCIQFNTFVTSGNMKEKGSWASLVGPSDPAAPHRVLQSHANLPVWGQLLDTPG